MSIEDIYAKIMKKVFGLLVDFLTPVLPFRILLNEKP